METEPSRPQPDGVARPDGAGRAATVALVRLGSWTPTDDAVGLLATRLGEGETLFPWGPSARRVTDAAADELRRWRAAGIGVVAFPEAAYPAQLRPGGGPPLLFSRGQVVPGERGVAVVGTRSASPAGLRRAGELARALASAGVTVVSGLAAGIDTAAHRATLDVGGRTIGVIGTGVNRCYPAANAGLQRRIAREGLLISPFWPDAPPTATSFLERNRVMAGLTIATVVVEAGERSGARAQARMALELGRAVILPRELLAQPWARAFAARPGVHVIDHPSALVAVTAAATGR